MFLPQILRQQTMPSTATVTHSTGGYISASGAQEVCDAPVFAPYGVCGLPCEGAQALLIPTEGGAVCAGVLCKPPAGMQPGEVRLSSAGGAYILLKNSGEVEINGLVITSGGHIAESGVG